MTASRGATKTVPVFFDTAQAFRAWLAGESARSPELWVGFHRLETGRAGMRPSEAVDQALCFGWIDGRGRSLDETAYMIRFTPRRAASIWSIVNLAKVELLRAMGMMTAAGEAACARRVPERTGLYAHERGSPPRLGRADALTFKRDAAAWTYFRACPPGYRQRAIHWVQAARRRDTQARRLARLMDASRSSERLAGL